jgi:hypothetical protein
MALALLASLALAASQPAPAADPSGIYVFEGSCPTLNAGYRGQLEIRGAGMFYVLTWQIDGETLAGTGFLSDRHMAVQFNRATGTEGGMMEMTRNGRRWHGAWAYYGSSERCSETWTPV